ncbi:helix-turn-helix transcriptional regulator [Lentilactobacillus senioris]|uniref:helix-turn-helix transcriptional regulator n=1 Tax=Lentilactobacillus senioris TaxID=931534 RepID=UPI0022800F3C|nr:helix-turn-helix transcriptional regulator [Lentilactobacillus senioris]MCY9807079.1 helix-turn-helix transcriptional regulator [Lentilactobacillus senioris]
MDKKVTAKLFIKDNEQIQSLMISQGLGNTELAKSAGVTASYISSIINGKKSVGRRTAFKISKKLGVTIDDIFFKRFVDKSYTEDMQPS